MDKITKLNKKLEEIQDNYKTWKESGLNEELLIIYLKEKTGLGKKDILKMLTCMNTFFDDLLSNEMVEGL